MKYINQSICVFKVSCISNVKQDSVYRPTVLFINPLACSYLEVYISWELMIWNRFIIHLTGGRYNKLVTTGINIFFNPLDQLHPSDLFCSLGWLW